MSIRILCIDDNPDSIFLTKRVLEKSSMSCQVDAAKDATEGMSKVRSQTYDMVLCDYRLPGSSGVDFTAQLQSQGIKIPVVVMTSAGSERIAVEAMKKGAYDYVVKDASYDDVLPEIIRQVLERCRERKERERLEVECNKAMEDLKKEKAFLEKMNSIMMDRERRILELKQEINTLLKELGRSPKYTTLNGGGTPNDAKE